MTGTRGPVPTWSPGPTVRHLYTLFRARRTQSQERVLCSGKHQLVGLSLHNSHSPPPRAHMRFVGTARPLCPKTSVWRLSLFLAWLHERTGARKAEKVTKGRGWRCPGSHPCQGEHVSFLQQSRLCSGEEGDPGCKDSVPGEAAMRSKGRLVSSRGRRRTPG